jgi:L-xylulokinase
MGKKYLLGLDNGGTVIKAGLYDTAGSAAAFASAEVEAIVGRNGAVERDMDELWRMNARAIRACIQKAGIDPKDIIGAAVCGHGNGLYLIDEGGRPVRNGVYSSDTRAKDYVRRFVKDGTYDKIQPKTMQVLYAGQPTVLIAYLKAHEPEKLAKARWALTSTDYIRFCLTGEVYGEITNMSAVSAMDQRTRKYDGEVFQSLGIREYMRLFPPLKQSCEVCGRVTETAARETGLSEGTPVAGGLYDGTACAIATGITDGSKFCVVAGTWSINEFICREPVTSRDLFLTSVYCLDGYYMVTEGSMTSASNLEWFVRKFLTEEKRQMKEEGKSVYEAADAMVSAIGPEESAIVFMPFLYGTNVNPDAKACFMGVCSWHEKAHLLRAVYEGVVFSHLNHIEKLYKFRGGRPESVRIAGGVANSRVWVQMFADVLQLPVEVSDVGELGTLGAALCAGVASGACASLEEAAGLFSGTAYTCSPDPAKKDIYGKKYALYKKILDAMEPVWADWLV